MVDRERNNAPLGHAAPTHRRGERTHRTGLPWTLRRARVDHLAGDPDCLVPAYVMLAKHLADGHRSDREGSEPNHDVAAVVAELRNAALDLRGLKATDPELNAIAAEARRDFEDAATHIERIAALPRPPGA